MKKFNGANGCMWFDNANIYIERKSWTDTLLHEEVIIKIPFSHISDIVVEEGGITNGFISVVEVGYSAPSSIFSALRDENTVIFRLFKNGKALRFVEKLKTLI